MPLKTLPSALPPDTSPQHQHLCFACRDVMLPSHTQFLYTLPVTRWCKGYRIQGQLLQRQARRKERNIYFILSQFQQSTLQKFYRKHVPPGSIKHIHMYWGTLLSFTTRQDSRAHPAPGHHSHFRSFSSTFHSDIWKISWLCWLYTHPTEYKQGVNALYPI